MTAISSRARLAGCALSLLGLALARPAQAADLTWKGLDWNFTDGGMAGVAAGASSNISVDGSGYLHLKITKSGNTWTASELFTTQKLGFGTYQWQIEGPVDTFDKNNVLGLFPYGPAAGIGGDGTNEIDIEFSRWGQANGVNADFTDYPNSGTVVGETSFDFSLGGSTSSTARFVWNSTSIESSVLKGHQALASETGLLKKWKYAPNNPSVNIPQQAMPLGMNLWCFEAPPSDGQNVEIVIRDFQFVQEGDPLPGNGGTGGTAGTGSAGMAGNAGSASGGAASGGSNSGGSAAGGANSAGTGSANGGSANGGNANGGNAGSSQPSGGGGAAPSGAGGQTSGDATGRAGSASLPTAGASSASAGSANATADETSADSGCGCRQAGGAPSRVAWAALACLTLLGLRRRQAPR